MYQRYRVLSVKIKCSFSTDADTLQPITAAIYFTPKATAVTSGWIVNNEAIRGNKNAVSTEITAYRPKTLSLYRKISSVLGDSFQADDDNYSAQLAMSGPNNPNQLVFGYITVLSPTATGLISVKVYLKTEITIYAKLWQPAQALQNWSPIESNVNKMKL